MTTPPRHTVLLLSGGLDSSVLLADLLRRGGDRQILAGDFNSTPWSFARRREDDA